MFRPFLPLLLVTSLTAEEKRVPTAQAMGLLKTQCMGCHNAAKKKGDLSLETRESALEAIQSGKIISSLTATGDEHMPPKKQLLEKQINLLKAWVQGGAAW
ncbi:MAG: c-type cytochrome domain-containing protein, partial [Prosthecobacter sp.]